MHSVRQSQQQTEAWGSWLAFVPARHTQLSHSQPTGRVGREQLRLLSVRDQTDRPAKATQHSVSTRFADTQPNMWTAMPNIGGRCRTSTAGSLRPDQHTSTAQHSTVIQSSKAATRPAQSSCLYPATAELSCGPCGRRTPHSAPTVAYTADSRPAPEAPNNPQLRRRHPVTAAPPPRSPAAPGLTVGRHAVRRHPVHGRPVLRRHRRRRRHAGAAGSRAGAALASTAAAGVSVLQAGRVLVLHRGLAGRVE